MQPILGFVDRTFPFTNEDLYPVVCSWNTWKKKIVVFAKLNSVKVFWAGCNMLESRFLKIGFHWAVHIESGNI